jgi:hypothetical protein
MCVSCNGYRINARRDQHANALFTVTLRPCGVTAITLL